jgi:hypothetical protein
MSIKRTENEVILAIDLLTNIRTYSSATPDVKILSSALENLMDEGLFDGSLESAIGCLTNQGYVIELE